MRIYSMTIRSVITLRVVRSGPPPEGHKWRPMRVNVPGDHLRPAIALGLADKVGERLSDGKPYRVQRKDGGFVVKIED